MRCMKDYGLIWIQIDLDFVNQASIEVRTTPNLKTREIQKVLMMLQYSIAWASFLQYWTTATIWAQLL